MANLSISKAWDETKAVLSRDGKLLASVALALIVLPATVMGLFAPPLTTDEAPGWVKWLGFIVALIGIAAQISIIRLALGGSVSVGEAIAHGFRRLLPVFLSLFLLGFIFALALVPLFLVLGGPGALEAAAAGRAPPGLSLAVLIAIIGLVLLAARLQLITPVGSGEEGGAFALIRRSWQLSKGHFWRLLAFLLLSLFLAVVLVIFLGQIVGGVIVGAVAGSIEQFSVGALFAGLLAGIAQATFSAIMSVMLARIYLQLFAGSAEASVPSTEA